MNLMKKARARATPWLFLAPALVVIFLVDIYPFYITWNLSLRSYEFSHPETLYQPVGLTNYHRMVHDPEFWESILISIEVVVNTVTAEFFLGLGIALLLFHAIGDRLRGILIIPLILPMSLAPVVVGLMFKFILQGDFGIATYYAKELFGWFRDVSILGSAATVLPAIILIDIWHWTPFVMLILLAGMLALPREPYEAAMIDGASWWTQFRYITIPILKPLIGIVLILRGMDAFKLFDEIYILTGGGPGTASEVLMQYVFRVNFKWWNMGYGAAVSLLFFIIILLLCDVFWSLTKRVA